MRIITLMSVFLLVLMILNCSDKNSSGPDNSQSDLVVSFSRSLHKEAYIILHSLDGQEVKSIQTIGTNEIATFQGIDESRVTFTVVFQDTSHSRYDKNVCFLSYFNVPINQYLLNGPSGPILGYADVTLDSPDSSYSRSLVSIPHYGKASSSTASTNFEVRKLCSNGKLTLFASLINSDELFGFYGWLQDQDFEYNVSNEYTITLNNPLQIKVLQTNLPITDYSLGALLNPYGEQGGSPNLYFWQDTDFRRNFESEYTEFSLFYAPYFPKDYYNLNVSYHNQDELYSYTVVEKDLPNSITIPSGNITASFDNENGSITQVSITGKADYIKGFWSVEESRQFYHTWAVVTAPESQTIIRPFIPDSIFAQYNVNFTTNFQVDLTMYDYDNVEGFDDYLKKSSESREQNINKLYRKMYYYRKYNINASGILNKPMVQNKIREYERDACY